MAVPSGSNYETTQNDPKTLTSGMSLTMASADSDALLELDDPEVPTYSERDFTRQLRGWLSYAFARCVYRLEQWS